MNDRHLSHAEYRTLKSRLTRALKRGPAAVLAEVNYFRAACRGRVMPDDWHRWNIAATDAIFALQRTGVYVDFEPL